MNIIKHVTGKFPKILLTVVMLVMILGITVSAADRKVTMTKDSDGIYTYIGVNANSDDVFYHQITVPKSGLLYVTGSDIYLNNSNDPDSIDYSSMPVQIYSKKMKPLDDTYRSVNALTEECAIYGVKKGTYYIRTRGHSNYAVFAVFQPITNKGGKSKAKAFPLRRTQIIDGVMPVGETLKTADWYTFQVKKKKVIRIDIAALNNSSFDFYLYGPSFKKGVRICPLTDGTYTYRSTKTKNKKKLKVKPGIYYLKVVRTFDAKTSGIYSLRWR